MEHTLTITSDGDATCSCGAVFTTLVQGEDDFNANEAFTSWQHHVKVPALLETLREQVEVEYRAKQMVENTVRELAKLGVATRIISDNTVVDGTPSVSPTVVQRLVRDPKPRRRYTKKAAVPAPKKPAKRDAIKKE